MSEPWADEHAPQKFDRYDKTGRWSPLHTKEEPATPWGLAMLGGAGFIFVVTFLWWALT